jgi:AcrR family transcriptional regulator
MKFSSAIEPRQARSRQTQQAILDATERLMKEKPFEKLSVAEITHEAGISVGNFYNRFPDKTALLTTLFDEYAKERTARLLDAFSPKQWQDQNLQTRADGLVELLVDFFWSRRALIRSYILFYRSNPEAAPAGTADNLKKISRAGAGILSDALPHRANAAEAAAMGLQIVVALCREFILFGDDPSKAALGLNRKRLTQMLNQVLVTYIEKAVEIPESA